MRVARKAVQGHRRSMTESDSSARRFIRLAPDRRAARGRSRIEPCGGADVKGGDAANARDLRHKRRCGRRDRTRASDDVVPLATIY
jgi:hypothetical protein